MNKTIINNPPPRLTNVSKKKITWIVILQGLTMFLVVLGHSDLNQKETITWVGELYNFFRPFRMPLFLLISGYLFCITRIQKHKSYSFVIKDKFIRLGIPYLCFTIIGLITKLLSSAFIKSPVEIHSLYDFISIFVGLKANPLSALWFIQVTLLLMMAYPLYKMILKNNYLICIFSIFLIYLYYDSTIYQDIILFSFSSAMHLWIFFWTGILIAHWQIDKLIVGKLQPLFIAIIAYIFLYLSSRFVYLGLALLVSTAGIVMAFYFAKTAEKLFPNIFNSFRNNTYQIYLMSIFPQMGIEIIYRFIGEKYFLPFFFTNIIVGLYFPILIVKIVQRYNIKWAKMVIGLS